jgi:hypothetical protein
MAMAQPTQGEDDCVAMRRWEWRPTGACMQISIGGLSLDPNF